MLDQQSEINDLRAEVARIRGRYQRLLDALVLEYRANLERSEWCTRSVERHLDALRAAWDLDSGD